MIDHANGSRVGRVFSSVYVSICRYVYFSTQYLKSDAARIIIDMVLYVSWKPIYFGVRRSR